jgi:hypothetical protein
MSPVPVNLPMVLVSGKSSSDPSVGGSRLLVLRQMSIAREHDQIRRKSVDIRRS